MRDYKELWGVIRVYSSTYWIQYWYALLSLSLSFSTHRVDTYITSHSTPKHTHTSPKHQYRHWRLSFWTFTNPHEILEVCVCVCVREIERFERDLKGVWKVKKTKKQTHLSLNADDKTCCDGLWVSNVITRCSTGYRLSSNLRRLVRFSIKVATSVQSTRNISLLVPRGKTNFCKIPVPGNEYY